MTSSARCGRLLSGIGLDATHREMFGRHCRTAVVPPDDFVFERLRDARLARGRRMNPVDADEVNVRFEQTIQIDHVAQSMLVRELHDACVELTNFGQCRWT